MADIVTLAETKTHLGISHTDDDARLSQLITQLSADVEKYASKSFAAVIAQTDVLDGGVEALVLTRRPVGTVTAIVDRNDNSTIDPAFYDLSAQAGMIWPKPSAELFAPVPAFVFDVLGGATLWNQGRRRWQAQYTHGYTSAPADVKLAALKLIRNEYEHPGAMISEHIGDYGYTRDAAAAGLMNDVQRLLAPYREIYI